MDDAHPARYRDFWPLYVGAHRRSGTRQLHFAGTSVVLGLFAATGALAEPWLIAAAPVAGYGPAWLGHALIERNRPATFSHPIWSLIGDFHMYALMWCGRMSGEIARLRREGRLPVDLDDRKINKQANRF